jgi:hypothetical protein
MKRRRLSSAPTFSPDPDEQRHLADIYHSGKPGHDPHPTIRSAAPTRAYCDGWSRIFGKTKAR